MLFQADSSFLFKMYINIMAEVSPFGMHIGHILLFYCVLSRTSLIF